MFVINGGEIVTMEDYDFLTSTMLKIVDLDSKKNELNSKLKIAKNKVKSDEEKIRNLSKEIKKLEKEKPPVDSRSEERLEDYTAKIQKYQEEILEIKEVIQQLERDSPVEELEEKRRKKWLTLTGKRREDAGDTYTKWFWWTLWLLLIGPLISIMAIQEIGYLTGGDWSACTEEELIESASSDWADGLTEDEIAERCSETNAGVLYSLFVIIVLGGIFAWLTHSRLQKIDTIILEIDEYNAKIKFQKDAISKREQQIKSIEKDIRKRDRSWNETVKSFEKSQTKLEQYRVKLEEEELKLSKSNMKVDELKKKIADNKKLIKSFLESVNHLVPYNEHI